ncbi:MAG: hypothetical protein NTX86_00345 [Candidatus Dependentiae bacterium]|nr:hypothetical protein [Candidatus Dependentiae bacterium]
MKKMNIMATYLLLLLPTQIFGAGAQETSTGGRNRNQINFEGILTTQEGNIYQVEQLSFNRLIKQIPVFEMPNEQASTLNPEPSKKGMIEYMLSENPEKKFAVFKIDLAETKTIEAPEPNRIWNYQTKPGKIARRYIKIIVTDNAGKTDSYLVENTKTLYCAEKTPAGPKELEIKMPAFKRLEITGYSKEENENDKKNKAKQSKTPAEKKASNKQYGHSEKITKA